MKLSNYVISKLVPFVVGDDHEPYRSGTQLIELFNEYGGYDYLPSKGMPMMPNSHLKYSRRVFAEQKMEEMNNTDGLRQLLEFVIDHSEKPTTPTEIGKIMERDGYSIVKDGEAYRIVGGVIENTPPVATEAYFHNLESKVISALDDAKVSICVAMAWFTNERIKEKLLEKKKAGVEVDIIIYEDSVNHKYGVDLSELPHTSIRGSRGGVMHNKFCVIDNQTVLTGSYNWTKNAETSNDENVSVLKDPKRASEFSVEFKKIKKIKV